MHSLSCRDLDEKINSTFMSVSSAELKASDKGPFVTTLSPGLKAVLQLCQPQAKRLPCHNPKWANPVCASKPEAKVNCGDIH